MKSLRLVITRRRRERSPRTPKTPSPLDVTPQESKDELFTTAIRKRQSLYHSVNELLAGMSEDEDLRDMIKLFALQEHSHENVLLFDAIQKYKKCDPQQSKPVAIDIVRNYLLSTSQYEVNIGYKCSEEIDRILETENSTQPLPPDVFKSVEDALLENMLDIMARFMRSSMYVDYKMLDSQKDQHLQSTARKRMSVFFNKNDCKTETIKASSLAVPTASSRLSFKFWGSNKA
jgi:hypothetical protein